jgi:hypothetical protein
MGGWEYVFAGMPTVDPDAVDVVPAVVAAKLAAALERMRASWPQDFARDTLAEYHAACPADGEDARLKRDVDSALRDWDALDEERRRG